MKALFKELPPFERVRTDYLDDDGYRGLQRLERLNGGPILTGELDIDKLFGEEDLLKF